MQLQKILTFIDHRIISGNADTDVFNVVFDSRKTREKSVFVAKRGLTVDGHTFIAEQISKGIAAIVANEFSERDIELAKNKNVTLVQTEDTLYSGGILVSAMHDFPSTKMQMIGVTGTDGKTTTSNLIYHMLKMSGKKVGLISTLSAQIYDGINEIVNDTGFHVTTPEVEEIQKYLSEMVSAGCEYAVVEATSHAFDQERLAGINFNVGVVTNITHEHLDYHKSIERYVLAKSRLFKIDKTLPESKYNDRVAIINQDDKAWEYLLPYTTDWSRIGYGFNDFADYRVVGFEQKNDGNSFVMQKHDSNGNVVSQCNVVTAMYGTYNILNATAAISCLAELGFPVEETSSKLVSFNGLSGRFEKFSTNNHGLVVVDFAHTPRALEEVLKLARSLADGKVVVVFGCAGLRDVEKRYLMGEIAGEMSDVSIVTAEDPRTESLDDISSRIIRGLVDAGAQVYPLDQISKVESDKVREMLTEHFPVYLRIDDRRQAISSAIKMAGNGDVVLICGKGHELSMNYGNGEEPWSDQEVVKDVICSLEKQN